MRKLPLLLVVLLVLAFAGGCGGGDDKSTTGDDAGSAKAAATPAISSGVEGVPIPRDSHRSQENKSLFEVLGMTYDELVDWYDAHLPEGKDFEGWQWCDTDVDAENPSRRYSKGSRVLSVALTDDTPPGVLVRVKPGTC
jgi:hypothetical protein